MSARTACGANTAHPPPLTYLRWILRSSIAKYHLCTPFMMPKAYVRHRSSYGSCKYRKTELPDRTGPRSECAKGVNLPDMVPTVQIESYFAKMNFHTYTNIHSCTGMGTPGMWCQCVVSFWDRYPAPPLFLLLFQDPAS